MLDCLAMLRHKQLTRFEPHADALLARVAAMPPLYPTKRQRAYCRRHIERPPAGKSRVSIGLALRAPTSYPLCRLLYHHRPRVEGDLVYRILDTLLARTEGAQPLKPPCDEVEEYLKDISGIMRDMSRSNNAWTSATRAEILLMIGLLSRHGFERDIDGHNFAWHLVENSSLELLQWWSSLGMLRRTDVQWRAPAGAPVGEGLLALARKCLPKYEDNT
jgi:hypothetical protein